MFSTGPFCASSRSPSCSCSAVKIVGPESAAARHELDEPALRVRIGGLDRRDLEGQLGKAWTHQE
jgi:hypothetical protein